MRKYLLRYLVFWVPAVVVAYFFSSAAFPSQIAQWFTAFFMLFGWGINTGMAAYRHPLPTLSFLLCYAGLNILVVMTMYSAEVGGAMYVFLHRFGGIFSFQAVNIFVQTLKGYPGLYAELVVVEVLLGCALVGYLVGLVQRRVNPSPYSPRIFRH